MSTNRKLPRRTEPLGWVVVANAARARVFERDDENGAMHETFDLVHPAARIRASALDSARPGRARKSEASTAFEPHTPVPERERARFAAELAQQLEQAALGHQMAGLVLLASNPFLGEIKSHLGPAARHQLKGAVASDFTSFRGAELEQRVSRALQGLPSELAAAE